VITSLTVQSGFAKALVPKKLTFKPGLNILFGPNGSGKTTVLKLLAAYSGCFAGGWTEMPLPCFSLIHEDNEKIDWSRVLCEKAPGKCKAKISWDGTPSYFFNPQTDKTPSFFGDNDKIINDEDAILEIVNKLSAGQKRLFRLHRMVDALKAIPDQTKVPKVIPTFEGPRNFVTVNSLYQNFATKWAEFMSSFKDKANVATILMDEPDRSLAIPETALLWSNALINLATKAQVIVATHSTFSLRNEDAHWVTMGTDQDYVKKCREALKC